MDTQDTLGKILALSDSELFTRAARIAATHSKAYWYPVPIHGGCTTDPPCRHCKWESFKKDRPGFSDKKSLDEILRSAAAGIAAGATHLLVPSGWMGYDVPDYFCDGIRAIKNRFAAEVYGLFGAIGETALRKLQDAGMDGYQCGLESPDAAIYRKFRPGGDSLTDRVKTLNHARKLGLKVWSGFLLAFGLTDEAACDGLRYLRDIDADCVAIQPFVPYPYTAFQAENPTNPYRWARLMAAARLFMGSHVRIVASENCGAYENFMALTGADSFYIFPRAGK
jgi:biotin synthase